MSNSAFIKLGNRIGFVRGNDEFEEAIGYSAMNMSRKADGTLCGGEETS